MVPNALHYTATVTTGSLVVPQARRRSVAFAVGIPALLLVSLIAWAFASPVGSSPDDDFHVASIWCGLGERPGLCEDSGDPATRLVPAALGDSTCFAFRADQSADCWDPTTAGMIETARVNTGLYPPVYYGIMSLFASPDVQASVLAVRVANSVLAVGLLTAAFWALPWRLRPALALSAIGASVPLGLFLVPSTNPSSWAYLSAAIVWICTYGAAATAGRRRWVLAGLAVVGGALGAGARADAAVFAIFGVIIGLVLGARRGPALAAPVVAGVVVAATSLGLYSVAGQGTAVVAGLTPDAPPLTPSQHASNLLNIPFLWTGAFGTWGLGWLDTHLPAVVSTLSLAVAFGIVFIGIRRLSVRRTIALLLVFAALWVVPFALLAQSNALIGEQVQPRYVLPLLVILLGVASASENTWRWWRGPRAVVAASALATAAAIALHDNIRRYTTGLDDQALDPGASAEWWWNGAPSPLAVWVIGSAAFAVALGLLVVTLRDAHTGSQRDRPPAPSGGQATSAMSTVSAGQSEG